jgi:hypothetical protein
MQWEKPSPNLNPVAAFSFAISARAALCGYKAHQNLFRNQSLMGRVLRSNNRRASWDWLNT